MWEPEDEDQLPAIAADRELCDVCARVIGQEEAFFALVRDSSAVHPRCPDSDGRRLLVGCCEGHLRQRMAVYEQRPWFPQEQWAGRVERALFRIAAEATITVAELARQAGLEEAQVRAGVKLLRRRKAGQWPPPGIVPA